MEKVQIPVNKSEYMIYYNYCLKYYQAHDTARKQSIDTFINLFLKGVIPVENQDISQARRLLSGKSDDLKKEHYGSEKGDPKIHLQIRVLSDLLLFIEDLEKMCRLIQKDGIVPDYLMLLGTFSKIIEENRNTHPAVSYELKKDVIASLVLPLVDSIRLRLGTDRQWRSVLRELTFIASRFNLRSSELKFDLDCLQLVAPAVVSYFDSGVESREILSVLPSYFEERELEEFASFLNHASDPKKNEQDTGINWDALYQPLKAVAAEVAIQRDLGYPGSLNTSDLYSLTPVSGRFPAPQAHDYKTFDIMVSPDTTNPDYSPPGIGSRPDTPTRKPGIKPIILVICGIVVLIAFILGTMMFLGNGNGSGTGNPAGLADVTITITTPIQPITTVKPTTPPTPEETPPPTPSARPTASPTPAQKVYTAADIGNHLIEIAYGPDNSVIKKSTKNPMDISYKGGYNSEDIALLNNFINTFNIYSSTIKISSSPNFESPGDFTINFLPEIALSQVETDQNTTSVYQSPETGTYYFVRMPETTYVNTDLKGNERKRWVYRAILHNLGFYGETTKYDDSVFYTGPNNASQLSDIDWKAVQLMYGKKITNGMTKANVRTAAI